eukprot:Gb_03504 [translate_table: standard]
MTIILTVYINPSSQKKKHKRKREKGTIVSIGNLIPSIVVNSALILLRVILAEVLEWVAGFLLGSTITGCSTHFLDFIPRRGALPGLLMSRTHFCGVLYALANGIRYVSLGRGTRHRDHLHAPVPNNPAISSTDTSHRLVLKFQRGRSHSCVF